MKCSISLDFDDNFESLCLILCSVNKYIKFIYILSYMKYFGPV